MNRRWIPAALWLLILAACAWQVQRTAIVSDLTHFLPFRTSVIERVLVGQMKHGVASRLILMAVEGGDAQQMAAISRALTVELKSNPSFASVHNGSEELTEETRQFLFRHRYVLSPEVSVDAFTEEGLRRNLQARLQELASPAGLMTKATLASDPTGHFRDLMSVWLPQNGPLLRYGVWFSTDARRALLVAETHSAGFDLDAQAHAVGAIREAFERVRVDTSVRLLMAGPPVFSVDANANISTDATRLSALNGLAVTVILWLVYRSLRVILLGFIPLVSGALVGAAAVGAWFGSLHGITLGFGAALIGVAADYPNHLFTHLEPGETAQRSIQRIWPTLRLGVLTNVAGFAAMLFSGFEGLAQLGLFAVAGLLAAAAAVRWVLPTLMPEAISISKVMLGLLGNLPNRPGWLSGLPVLLGLGAAAQLMMSPGAVWNNDIDALSPVPMESKRLDETLRRDLGAPDLRKLILVLGDTPEDVLVRSEALAGRLDVLKARGSIGGFDMAARYLPSMATQRIRQLAIPSERELSTRLKSALHDLPFRDGVFAPFLQDAAASKASEPVRLDDPIPDAITLKVRSLLFQDNGAWVGLVPLRGVLVESALHDALRDLSGSQLIAVDLREESSRLLADYRREALELLSWSSLAIVVLLSVGLRSVVQVGRVLLPMVCAAAVTAAIMARSGEGLSLFHLISLLLVMGLSLDQALFFNRPAEHADDRARTLLSLLLCNVSAVIAFGILATSSINILHEIGATVATGAAFALLFGALLARNQRSPA